MHPLAPYLTIPLLIGAAITFALAIYAVGRRNEPGVPAFVVTAIGLGAWSICYSLEIMSTEVEFKLFWHRMIYSLLPLVPGPWALFLYQYGARKKHVDPWIPVALAIQPLIFIVLTWTNDSLHQLLWTSVSQPPDVSDLVFVRGPFFWIHTGYSYTLILVATIFFVRLLWREPTLHRWQIGLLGLLAVSPMIANLIHVAGYNPFYPLDLTPFALATTGTASAWFVFRFELWDFLPAARNAIVESMSDGMIILNLDDMIVDVNPAALALLALERNDAIGQPIGAVLPDWETILPQQNPRGRRSNRAAAQWEIMLPNRQEDLYVDLVYSNVYDRNRRVTGALISLRDVTRRKHAEQELAHERTLLSKRVAEQTSDLRKANSELARVALMKDEFLANMSHELRTPLNTVLGLSEALQEQVYGPLMERQVRALRNIEESGRHLLTLINDILDVSKIEAGKLELEMQPTNVDEVCQGSLGLVRQLAHKKRIELFYHGQPNGILMMADERRLKQMLVNLLSNAVKFTNEGGQVGLDVQRDGQDETIQFCVWDTGLGIGEEDLTRLFQPFVQLDSRLARQHEGSGLGLALVYRMAELHGGSIHVQSTLGEGSRFTIALPCQEPSMPAFMSTNEVSAELLNRLHQVLLVDDQADSVEQLRRYLLELGAETLTPPPQVAPLEYARQVQPDLIIIDQFYSGEAENGLVNKLADDPALRTIPVLALSVVADVLKQEEIVKQSGRRIHYLLKPVSRQQFGNALVKILAPAPTQPALLTGGAPQNAVVADDEKPFILIVEDNETNIRTLVDYLTAKNFRHDVARSGTEAMELVRIQRPDLILMDIQMPGMDGLETTRLIRADEGLRTIPIIALTALAMPGDREKTLAAGADEYLSKPVSLKRLLVLMERFLAVKSDE